MFRVGVWRQCGISRPNSTFRIAEHFSVVSRRDDVADEIRTGASRAKIGLD
jgi:hypothetical protein